MVCSICLGSFDVREDKLNMSIKNSSDFPNVNKTETDIEVLASRSSYRNRILRQMSFCKKIRQIKMSFKRSLDRCIRRCDGESTSDACYMYTPCSHLFHAECLRAWMEIKSSCPECRRNLPVDHDQPAIHLQLQ